LNGPSSHEARAGNPLQLALIGIATVLVFSRPFGDRATRWYAVGLIASFLLFCAMIRWQPWNSRYHLPLFALGLAMAGVVIERSRSRVAIGILTCLLLVSALPFALMNSIRPLAPWMSTSILREPRLNSYFADSHRWWIHSYVPAAEFVQASHCDRIEVDSSLEDFDYPVFMLLGADHGTMQVRYADVKNLTAAYARPDSKAPCAVICLRCANAPAKWAEYKQVGGRVSVFDEVAVFGEKGSLANIKRIILPTQVQAEQILKELDNYRDSPHGIDFGPTETKVRSAGRDWPAKRTDLKDRLDALYTNTLTLWRVRDSVDPLRRRGEPVDDSKIDPIQLVAASQVFTNWDKTLPSRVEELNGLVDQLYSSWERTLVTVRTLNSSATHSKSCQLDIKTVQSRLNGPDSKTESTTLEEPSVEVSDCSCLEKTYRAGGVLARKMFGKYDSESEIFTGCAVPSQHSELSSIRTPAQNVAADSVLQ
jgi:hypothetical protein